MKTEFITFEISLAKADGHWVRVVEDRLGTLGDPLRWALTQVNGDRQTATVEAVVTQAD